MQYEPKVYQKQCFFTWMNIDSLKLLHMLWLQIRAVHVTPKEFFLADFVASLSDTFFFQKKQAQESLVVAMSLRDISGIVTSWADCYKISNPNFNFSLWLYAL